ncbi:hypothetical protein RF11_04559 [Thelohanellus kitauei]|uniref:Uncharacterized protein n=1 Tax=Thelohanellus kitauei TaxID=669202 RepID=A0A0C2N5M2_THEKT|nr:hypothetical protein RF11_04559 [Thelohanellus kitauei]
MYELYQLHLYMIDKGPPQASKKCKHVALMPMAGFRYSFFLIDRMNRPLIMSSIDDNELLFGFYVLMGYISSKKAIIPVHPLRFGCHPCLVHSNTTRYVHKNEWVESCKN